MTYSPHSDFHVSIGGFPHIILEVNSQRTESDKFHMLLQAACLCRIGNGLRDSASSELIVIMAIYIDVNFKARQYILCQPDIKSTKVVFN